MRIKKGFTLLELIIVVIIVGILAAVAIPKASNIAGSMKAKAIATEAVMGASAMRRAVRNYTIEHPEYTGLIVIDFYTSNFVPASLQDSINPGDFVGIYFSKESYFGYRRGYSGSIPSGLLGRCYLNRNPADWPKKAEVEAMRDTSNDAYINIDTGKKITQVNFSRSGYPPS